MTKVPCIFVSYSHKDKAYADELVSHIGQLKRRFDFNIWSDREIHTGDHWKNEIENALSKADIAFILVSADYLASNWISDVELPSLLKQAEDGDTRIIPIILRASPWTHTSLTYFQAFPRNAEPLSTLSEVERDRAWVQIYEVLEAELHRLSKIEKPQNHSSIVQSKTTDSSNNDGKRKNTDSETLGQETPEIFNEENMPKFFISHAKEDRDFAENLRKR